MSKRKYTVEEEVQLLRDIITYLCNMLYKAKLMDKDMFGSVSSKLREIGGFNVQKEVEKKLYRIEEDGDVSRPW